MDACGICNEEKEKKESCIIPRSIRKSCSRDLKNSDFIFICKTCYNLWSNHIDEFVEKICKDNDFVRKSPRVLAETVSNLRKQAKLLELLMTDKISESYPDISFEKLKEYSNNIRTYLGHNYTVGDLIVIQKIRNNGKNPKLDSGAFIIELIGEEHFLKKIRNKFRYFKKNYSKIIDSSTKKKVKGRLKRKETYSIEEIFKLRTEWVEKIKTKPNFKYMKLGAEKIDMSSDRYELFHEKGTNCVHCGIEGKFFAKEKNQKMGWHLNLYASDEEGKDVLMTKDHIIPKSKGGEDLLSNYQPMCVKCNSRKGDKMPEDFRSEESADIEDNTDKHSE